MNGFPLVGFLACISFSLRVDDPVGRGLFVIGAILFGVAFVASIVDKNNRKGRR